MAEKLPVIIDDWGDNRVLHALQRLLPKLQRMDVVTGVFQVGLLLLLDGLWQDLERTRVLMGDETTRRTKREIVQAMRRTSNDSTEREKERDKVLTGLAADLHRWRLLAFSSRRWCARTAGGGPCGNSHRRDISLTSCRK